MTILHFISWIQKRSIQSISIPVVDQNDDSQLIHRWTVEDAFTHLQGEALTHFMKDVFSVPWVSSTVGVVTPFIFVERLCDLCRKSGVIKVCSQGVITVSICKYQESSFQIRAKYSTNKMHLSVHIRHEHYLSSIKPWYDRAVVFLHFPCWTEVCLKQHYVTFLP